MGSTYGAAGSLAVLLVWIYYSSIILYFGAEFTKAYALEKGAKIVPNAYAQWEDTPTVPGAKSKEPDRDSMGRSPHQPSAGLPELSYCEFKPDASCLEKKEKIVSLHREKLILVP